MTVKGKMVSASTKASSKDSMATGSSSSTVKTSSTASTASTSSTCSTKSAVNRPLKLRSGYNLFVKHYFSQYRLKHPNRQWNFSDVARKCGACWRDLCPEQKISFKSMAARYNEQKFSQADLDKVVLRLPDATCSKTIKKKASSDTASPAAASHSPHHSSPPCVRHLCSCGSCSSCRACYFAEQFMKTLHTLKEDSRLGNVVPSGRPSYTSEERRGTSSAKTELLSPHERPFEYVPCHTQVAKSNKRPLSPRTDCECCQHCNVSKRLRKD